MANPPKVPNVTNRLVALCVAVIGLTAAVPATAAPAGAHDSVFVASVAVSSPDGSGFASLRFVADGPVSQLTVRVCSDPLTCEEYRGTAEVHPTFDSGVRLTAVVPGLGDIDVSTFQVGGVLARGACVSENSRSAWAVANADFVLDGLLNGTIGPWSVDTTECSLWAEDAYLTPA